VETHDHDLIHVLHLLDRESSQYNGLLPDTSQYEFINIIGAKSCQFEAKWHIVFAPNGVQVCDGPDDVQSSDKVRETYALLKQGTPVIVQSSL
jgi:hypothetical protein